MTDPFDVIIIGAGPAGLSAGIVLSGHGLRTLVCEKRRFPTDKACGEGVMPVGMTHLARLGVTKHLREKDVRPFIGIRYHSPSGRTAAATFAEGPGWGIRRTALSTALLLRAKELDHLEIREETHAQPLERTADYIATQAGGERVFSRLLIGADGLNSRVRRWADLEKRTRMLQRWGVRQHYRIAPWSEYVEVHWKDGLEAYITPCADEQVGVAFLWDRARYPNVRGGEALFTSLLRAFPGLQARLDGACPCDTVRTVGPLHRAASAPVADGVLLIGDAAGYLDAITGEGISLATAQALCLEQTVVPLLQSQNKRETVPKARELMSYARAYRAIVKPYYQVTQLVLLLSRHPRLAERIIKALAQQPDVFQHMLSANMGLTPVWSIGLIQIARWARGLI